MTSARAPRELQLQQQQQQQPQRGDGAGAAGDRGRGGGAALGAGHGRRGRADDRSSKKVRAQACREGLAYSAAAAGAAAAAERRRRRKEERAAEAEGLGQGVFRDTFSRLNLLRRSVVGSGGGGRPRRPRRQARGAGGRRVDVLSLEEGGADAGTRKPHKHRRRGLPALRQLLYEKDAAGGGGPPALASLQEAFREIDTSGIGLISVRELVDAFVDCDVDVDSESCDRLVADMNGDRSGYLDFNEFVLFFGRVSELKSQNEKTEYKAECCSCIFITVFFVDVAVGFILFVLYARGGNDSEARGQLEQGLFICLAIFIPLFCLLIGIPIVQSSFKYIEARSAQRDANQFGEDDGSSDSGPGLLSDAATLAQQQQQQQQQRQEPLQLEDRKAESFPIDLDPTGCMSQGFNDTLTVLSQAQSLGTRSAPSAVVCHVAGRGAPEAAAAADAFGDAPAPRFGAEPAAVATRYDPAAFAAARAVYASSRANLAYNHPTAPGALGVQAAQSALRPVAAHDQRFQRQPLRPLPAPLR